MNKWKGMCVRVSETQIGEETERQRETEREILLSPSRSNMTYGTKNIILHMIHVKVSRDS